MLPRCLGLFISLVFLFPLRAQAQGFETVEIGHVQSARTLTASVHDPAGSPMAGVLVEELTADWKEPLRSTKTNTSGIFTFAPVPGRDIYYFQLTFKNFNPLRVRVKIDRKRGKALKLQMGLST